MLNNDLQPLFSFNLLHFGYCVSTVTEDIYNQNKGGFIMQHLQTSFFYDLQELIRNAPPLLARGRLVQMTASEMEMV